MSKRIRNVDYSGNRISIASDLPWSSKSTVFPYTFTQDSFVVDYSHAAVSGGCRYTVNINSCFVFDIIPANNTRVCNSFFVLKNDILNLNSVSGYNPPLYASFYAFPLK